ncbi:TA system VapC family ribonuclease toxin [Nocardia macrotermitis]|uniref:Ribonuclease VapC n=1 Tax=Nocardia macrotermitis TaxID=2585198 RepID=A0A7K0DEZ0_9NOCA|nr:TA system VapC family ribonuclease toxin [Nocardia macrotermitis]MQY23862.1 Ribonuclease VapC29 [Nocardia macrotermitis]
MTVLLDANVLIALVVTNHVHHDAAEMWFGELDDNFATCPITQGSLLRILLREGRETRTALEVLADVTDHERHEFWPDTIAFDGVRMDLVIGHRQVTDAYLAQLARMRQGKIATFDQGLAAVHPDVADLLR